jgi:hypothetical protein
MNYIIPIVSLGVLIMLLKIYDKKEPFSSIENIGNLTKLQNFYNMEKLITQTKPITNTKLMSSIDELEILYREVNNNYLDNMLLSDKLNLEIKKNIFIFNPTHVNARHWYSWGSRNSNELNEPYKLLCMQSVIKNMGNIYNVVIINDDSFEKLIPNWKIDMNKYSGVVKSQLQTLGLLKIIYLYGGLMLPSSFLCFKNLEELLNIKEFFVSNLQNNSILPSETCVSLKIFGAQRNNSQLKEFINEFSILNSNDYTDDITFNGKVKKILYKMILSNSIKELPPKTFGVVDANCKLVTTKDLLSEKKVSFSNSCLGLYINDKEILDRYSYQWFARMSAEQILTSNLEISKLMLKTLSN